MKRFKILHAPAIITHQQWTISRAQRKLGYKSDFMVFNADHIWQPQHNCDINFHFDRNKITFNPMKPVRLFKTFKFLIQFSIFFVMSLFKYDVFHFHSESFLGSHSDLDLKILRLLKKKIVFQYWGCDIRLKTLSILSEEFSACDDCIRVCQNARKVRDSLTHLKYADFRIYGGTDAIRMVPDAAYVPLAINLDYWKEVDQIPKEHLLPAIDAVRILHPFQNIKYRGDQKGTKFIKNAVEQLKNEGYKVDYLFLEKIPSDFMKYYYQQADIVVVQLLMGTYSNASIEAMAMAKPAICYLNKDAIRLLPKDIPIINANPRDITDKLRILVKDKQLRDELGKKGRTYVERHHDAIKIAQQYIDLYSKEWL